MKRGSLVLLGILVVVMLFIAGCGGAVIVYSEGDMRCMSNNAQLYTNDQWSNVKDCSAIDSVCETIIGEDLSVNENTAGISGATRVVGVIRRALSFDGVDDIGSAADSASLDISNEVTVEAWIKPDVNSRRTILAKCDNYWLETETDGRIRWSIKSSNGNLYILTSQSNDYSIGNWYHFVGVYDGKNMRAYVKGVEKFFRLDIVKPDGTSTSYYEQQLIETQLTPNNYDLTMAFMPDNCYTGPRSGKFDGAIDEVAIYNRALTDGEILQAYSNYQIGARPDLNDNNLAAYYGFEDSAICAGANNPPIASAVSPVSGFVGDIITLDGGGSSDPDINDVLSYSWGVVSLPEGVNVADLEVSGINSLNPSFVATVAGTYIFKLTVSDGITSASADVVVDVIRDPGYLSGFSDWASGLSGVGAGKGLSFDGVNDYVSVMDSTDPTSYSVEAWVRPNDVSNVNIITRTHGDPTIGFSHQLRINNAGKFQFKIFDITTKLVTGTTVVEPGKWYYVVGVAQNNGQMRLYVNGVEEDVSINNIGTMWVGGDRYYIGSNSGDGMGYFDGVMDEVAVYDRVLIDSEISEHYNNGNGLRLDLSDTAMRFYYGFDEGSGSEVGDLSSSGNTGALVNFIFDLNSKWVGGLAGVGSGKALDFDGINDFVSVAEDELNNILDVNDKVTISAWVKLDSYPVEFSSVVSKGNAAGQPRNYGMFVRNTRKVHLSYYNVGWRAYEVGDLGAAPWSGWHHLVGVIDTETTESPDKKIIIYIDGKLAGQLAQTYDMLANDYPLYIGNTKGYKLDGVIDEVSIWNVAVDDAASVMEIYNSYLNGARPDLSNPSLLVYYGFDEGSGDVVSNIKRG